MAFKLKFILFFYFNFLYLFATSSPDEKHKYLPKNKEKYKTANFKSTKHIIRFAFFRSLKHSKTKKLYETYFIYSDFES